MLTVIQATLLCPAMEVKPYGIHLKRTAIENMQGTFPLPDGTPIKMIVTIPETMVRWKHVGIWQVDACIGQGKDAAGNSFVVNLIPEPVVVDFATLTVVAKKIVCPDSTLYLPSGLVFNGPTTFPNAAFSLFTGQAAEVTATSELTLQGGTP
jgi:hypothetical protein